MQLLKITSTPIKYRIESEKATLTVSGTDPEQNIAGQAQNQRIVHPNDVSSYRNTIINNHETVNKESEKIRADKSFVSKMVVQGKNITDSANQYSRINSKVCNRSKTCGSVIQANSVSDINIAINRLKSVKPDDSWEPDKNIAEYSENDNYVAQKKLKFTPASYKLIVEEFADVKIEYLGGIDYFPESSAPDYEKPDDT